MRFDQTPPYDRYEWHPYIPYWPRRLTKTNTWVWLERIQRKRTSCGGYGAGFYWAYRDLPENEEPF